MRVKAKLFAIFQKLVGRKQIIISANNIRDLLQKLTTQYEELGGKFFEDLEERELRGGINIMVNGRSIRFLDGLDTRLKDDDLITIFPPVAGGQRTSELSARISAKLSTLERVDGCKGKI